jgi:hypothetical protein
MSFNQPARRQPISLMSGQAPSYKIEESASPRACFQFSETLAQARVDYTPFVTVSGFANAALSIEDQQLCVEGLKHGEHYKIVLREGLPSAINEALLKSADYEIYVRDRSPLVHFTGKNYVLPRTSGGTRATQWFIVSDLGITAFTGKDSMSVSTRQTISRGRRIAITHLRLRGKMHGWHCSAILMRKFPHDELDFRTPRLLPERAGDRAAAWPPDRTRHPAAPTSEWGARLTIQSALQPACGTWLIRKMDAILETLTHKGQWFIKLTCAAMDTEPPGDDQ